MSTDPRNLQDNEIVNSSATYYQSTSSEIGAAIAVGADAKYGSEFGDNSNLVERHAQSVDPHDLKNPGKPTTNMSTLMNLIKGNVGIGILAMPSALVNAGLIMGTSGILLLGFIATYCMKQLVDVSAHLSEKHPHIGILNYPDTCSEAFALGPPKIRFMAKYFRGLVNVFIVTAQLMGCTAYLLFVSGTISQLVTLLTPFSMKIQLWELIVLVAFLPYIQVRKLQVLSWFTTVANVCVLVSLLIVFQFVVRDRDIAIENFNIWGSISRYPLAFGTIIFAFEGINLVMPLRNKMKDPEAFGGWNGVLMLGMTIIAVLYAIIGFFGYLRIGDEFTGVLTDYLIPKITTDPIGWLYLICIILVVIQIYISYGLQLYVAVIILFPPIATHFKMTKRAAFIGESLFRCFLALVTFSLAAAIPCLGEIFDLVGAFTGSSLSILIPATIDLVVFVPVHLEEKNTKKLAILIAKNAIILVVGFAGFFIGTYTAIQEIVSKLTAGQCTQ